MVMDMAVETLISLEEYLGRSYSPDREYRNGVLMEPSVGDKAHARLQTLLARYLGRFEKQWGVISYTELRVKVRASWYSTPDFCIYPLPDFEGRYPEQPPLVWIEILAHDDRMVDVWAKANELVENGVPCVWIIDPNTLE